MIWVPVSITGTTMGFELMMKRLITGGKCCMFACRKHEQQEREKAARLQREVLQAAKEKERLRKEMEEKERKLVRDSSSL